MIQPSVFSIFRGFHRLLEEQEGPNDGLVSVSSSKWGGDVGYKGTLVGVSHLDLINWTNRLEWLIGELVGNKRKWDALLNVVLCLIIPANVCLAVDLMPLHF